MSSGDKSNPPEGPFLPDDDIGSELDEWDSTFDALHDDPETGTRLPRSQAPTKPPDWQPSPGPEAKGDYEDDDMRTPIPPGDTGEEVGPWLSTVSTQQKSPPAPVAPKRTGPAIVRRAMPATSPQPIEVRHRTSAVTAQVGAYPAFEESQGGSAGGGALDAPSSAPVPSGPDPTTAGPQQDRNDFPDSTEAVALEEDDYADMEIGGGPSRDAVGVVAEVAPRRTVAHVVRRSAQPTNVPFRPAVRPVQTSEPAAASIPVSEPATVPASDPFDETDFSDIAVPVAVDVEPLPAEALLDPEGVDEIITQPALRRALKSAAGNSTSAQSDNEVFRIEPSLRFETIRFPEQVQPLLSAQFDDQLAHSLLVFERELRLGDSPNVRIELARLHEHFADYERAREHYDAASRVEPHARSVLRGLRRVARATGDMSSAMQLLDTEMALAGATELRAMRDHKIDLLLDSGDHARAGAAIGEALASAPDDIRALLADLELALVHGSSADLCISLEQFAAALADPELRASLLAIRGAIAGSARDNGNALASFAAAVELLPASKAARLDRAWYLAAQGQPEASAAALFELMQRLEASDPLTVAALAMRAHVLNRRFGPTAAALATAAMPGDPLVARFAADANLVAGDPVFYVSALTRWAASSASTAERSYAACRAAELDPERGAELWRYAFDLEPDDDYAAAQLRTALIADGAPEKAIDIDRRVAGDGDRERVRLRAAFGLMGEGKVDDAIAILERGRIDHPESDVLVEALAEALASAARWEARARLLEQASRQPSEGGDPRRARIRMAVAWEDAAGAVAAAGTAAPDELRRIAAQALDAWRQVFADDRVRAPAFHAAAIVLATQLGDPRLHADVLVRAQQVDSSPWSAMSLALRRARLLAREEATEQEAELALRNDMPNVDDPRRAVWFVLAAARRKDRVAAATALDDRAVVLGSTSEAAALRLRAAQLALDGGESTLAAALLEKVEQAFPALLIVHETLAAVRRKAGDSRPPRLARRATTVSDAPSEEFVRLIRNAEFAVDQGDRATAIALYQSALELRRGDALVVQPLLRLVQASRDAMQISAVALARLREAETRGHAADKADFYQLLARVDRDLRGDSASAIVALENALQADPSRVDLMIWLQREYAKSKRIGEQLRLRRAEHDQLPLDLARDRAAVLMDAVGLADLEHRPKEEIAELCRLALEADPKRREALFRLETLFRSDGASIGLAQLEEQIAWYYAGDSRTQAAFYTRAGETLAEVGRLDTAVQKFAMAAEVLPGYVPALEGWRNSALRGELWVDVAQAASRLASASADPSHRARYHHFAGVVQMDKALVGDQAIAAFRKALEADPSHRDAFVRLRILLEEDASHEELAALLKNRLEVETQPAERLELHRALAELHRNFLDSRDIAKQYFREVLAAEANDLRAHAAIADIAWEQGNWQEAAEALIARARLERDAATLSTLCYRLGLIYADRIGDPAMALRAFQRALTYQPDDANTLVRLVDLASMVGEWQLALGACERLVANEQDADLRVAHLHRVARVLRLGFGDVKRAERALNLALDNAPTNDEALVQVVQFYREAGDMTSVRVHLNRVIGAMRARISTNPQDGVAYRVIARAMQARDAAGVAGSIAVAYSAAELATRFGAAGDSEQRVLAAPPRGRIGAFVGVDADDVLFPRGFPSELRQMFRLLDDRVGKHIGVDVRAYGVERNDRLRADDAPVAAVAQEVATALGLGELDVYVSTRVPFAMVAEPTSPWSLILGRSIASADTHAVRFAAGSALKLAQAGLAVPARLPAAELGTLVVALLRIFQPEFPSRGLDESALASQTQKLRRQISAALMAELKPFALAIDSVHFSVEQLAADLHTAALRAGLVASGSIAAGLTCLSARLGAAVLDSREAKLLLEFSVSEDYANLIR